MLNCKGSRYTHGLSRMWTARTRETRMRSPMGMRGLDPRIDIVLIHFEATMGLRSAI